MEKNTRRNFMKTLGVSIGIAGVTGSTSLLSSCTRVENNLGDKIKLLTSSGELVEVDKAQLKPADLPSLTENQKRGRLGLPGRSWVMVIDLSKCRNARECMKACQNHHQLRPEQHHMNVLQMQDAEHTAPYYMPKPCQHCDNPPCTKVCPVNATFKRDDGIVLIDNDRCIGCKFCVAGCPYSARIFHWKEVEMPEGLANRKYNPETSVPAKKGTVSKCDFCPDQSRMGKLPHCVTACPMGVIYFGDVNEDTVTNGDETIKFSEIIRDRAGYRYLADLGTAPLVYYLPPVNRQFPFESGLDNLSDEVMDRYKNTEYFKSKGE